MSKVQLEKLAVVNFMRMENAYCESYIQYLDLMNQRGHALFSRDMQSASLFDRDATSAAFQTSHIRRTLMANEAGVAKYGWESTWGQETPTAKKSNSPDDKKPLYLDGSQWQYIKDNSMMPLAGTESQYGWIGEPTGESGMPTVLVAKKNKNGEYLFVKHERFFCTEKKVIVEDSLRVIDGFVLADDQPSPPSPEAIISNSVTEEAYRKLCERHNSFFGWLKFWD
jgi:hypothetical protein